MENKKYEIVVTPNEGELKRGVLTNEGIIKKENFKYYFIGDDDMEYIASELTPVTVSIREKASMEKPYRIHIVDELEYQNAINGYENYIANLKSYPVPDLNFQEALLLKYNEGKREVIEGVDFEFEYQCLGEPGKWNKMEKESFLKFGGGGSGMKVIVIPVKKELKKEGWKSVAEKPKFGGEYIVTWKMDDGGEPTTTMMVYDAKTDIWNDPQGVPDKKINDEVLYWMEMPKPCIAIPVPATKEDVWAETKYLLIDCKNMLSQCESITIGKTEINIKIIGINNLITKINNKLKQDLE